MLSSSVLSEVQVVIAAIRFLLWCHLAEKGFGVAKAGQRVPQWEWSNKDGGHSISSEKHLSLSLSVCLCVFLSVFKKIHTSFHQGQVTFHSQLLSLSSLPSLADTLTNSTLIPPQAIYFSLKYMETRENTEIDQKIMIKISRLKVAKCWFMTQASRTLDRLNRIFY